MVLGLTLLIAMVWQGILGTEKATRWEMQETLNRATERLRILIRAAEMTSESAERAARTPEVTGTTLRSVLEHTLAAFEQRPELSYVGIVLPETGEYGNLERTATGEILYWNLPGKRDYDPVTRNFRLTDQGFTLHEERLGYDYDPRVRPFYQAALTGPEDGRWIPSYQWIVHSSDSEPLWGFSYVKALRDGSGRLFAVLDADFDIPALNSFLSSLDADYHIQLQVVELGDSPRMIGDPKAGRVPLPVPEELKPLLEFSGDSVVERMMLEGERRWVAAQRMVIKGGVSWLVVTSRKAPMIETPLGNQLYEVAGMGLAITAGLVFVSARMARRFGKPLAELERRVTVIGQSELAAPMATGKLAVDGFRETRLLGLALDRMELAVAQQLDSKEQQAATLALKGAIFDSTGTATFSLDQHLVIIEWNLAAERVFGLERKKVLGQSVLGSLRAPDGPANWDLILETPGIAAFQFIGSRGPFDAELRVAAFKQNGQEIRTVFLDDVSERKRADAALQESLARFNAAAKVTGDVIWEWDFMSNTRWWNENFQILFGYGLEEIEPTLEYWFSRIHSEDRDRVISHLQATVSADQETWFDEYRFRRKDGSYADLFDRGHVLRDDSGRGVRMIGAIQDVTERKLAEQRISYLATHDGLTGLPNRDLIQDRIVQAIAHARRTGGQFALLYLDLDRFKIINDGYGHPFGDEVLKVVAERFGELMREGDTVSRQGGDEFLILLPDLHNAAEAYIYAQKIIKDLDCPLFVQSRQVHVSASIGVSVFPQDGETADALIDNADVAMYRAKELGRNACHFFTREMSEEALRRVDLETQLRGAIAAGQLRLAYQAKVSLKSGTITGCEALLRWHHPERGVVSPAQFIPIAEDTGLIVPIGDWVLRSACRQAKAWADAGLAPVCVAVNISARQFMQQDVVSWVMRTLQETGIPPVLLELELTESLIAQDVDNVIATFSQLRAAGVKLSIDDFGTGYSSLNYLKRFRVDTLKIDQSFVRDMLSNPEDAAIVRAVISLAQSLEFKVIAEGVETESHCRFLSQNGCDEIQGYYFSKPLTPEEFESLLRSGKRLF